MKQSKQRSRVSRNRELLAAALPKAAPFEGRQDKPANIEVVRTIDEAVRRAQAMQGFAPPPTTLNVSEKVRIEREREILEATLLEEKQALALESFPYFVKNVAFPLTWKEHYGAPMHEQIMWEIQEMKPGQDLWLFVPREHRKSYLITVLHSVWMIIRDPNIRILIVGARKETIQGLIGLIRDAFTLGSPGWEHFQKVFLKFIHARKPGGEFSFKHKLRNQPLADPTVRGTYLGVAGASWRCDILKFDDPIERRHVTRPELAAKASRDMLDLLPLLATGSKYRYTTCAGTRWAYFDPYGMVIGEEHEDVDEEVIQAIREKMSSGKVKVMVRHGYEDPNRLCEHCPPHVVEQFPHGHPDMELGEVIADPVVTKELLEERYTQYLRDPKLGESLFFHQYLNVCQSPAAKKFDESWFFRLGTPTWGYVRKRVLAIDSADKDFQRGGQGDFMVALMGDFSEDGRLCNRHGLRSNAWTRDTFQDKIISWCQATGWWPSVVVKEKVSNDSFLSDMQKKFLNHGHPVHVVPMPRAPDTKKHDFIVDTLQAPMERGDVVWGSVCPASIVSRAVYELTNLAQTKNDDVADAETLFFVKGVRVMAANKAYDIANPPSQPPLQSYFPDRQIHSPQENPEASPFERAASSQRVATAIVDIGHSSVSFDPPVGPVLGYDLLPPGGKK